MEDIVPSLLKKIQDDFQKQFDKSETIRALYAKVRDGTATYLEANDFALETGEILANVYQKHLSSAVLPDGHMYYNIADRILTPTLINDYNLITEVTTDVQTMLNKKAGIGIKALVPEMNQDRVKGLIEKVVGSEKFDDVKWVLNEPVKNYAQSIVTDSIQKNAEFQYKSGMTPKIVRKSTSHCCEWCQRLENDYEYPDVPKTVYQRHDNCRCTVDYVLGKHRKNVHNNNTGKRRYVQDKYGNYVQSKEVRIQHAKEMAATEEERKANARRKRIATWEKKRSGKNNDSPNESSKGKNVTSEYERGKYPGQGKFTIEAGYDIEKHKDEVAVANWLYKNLGGDIKLLNESSLDGVKMPDYLWRNKFWELKSTSTEKAANSAIRKGIKQIEENPGGIILNYNSEINFQNAMEVIDRRMKGSKPNDISVDIMIIMKGKLLGVYRY